MYMDPLGNRKENAQLDKLIHSLRDHAGLFTVRAHLSHKMSHSAPLQHSDRAQLLKLCEAHGKLSLALECLAQRRLVPPAVLRIHDLSKVVLPICSVTKGRSKFGSVSLRRFI